MVLKITEPLRYVLQYYRIFTEMPAEMQQFYGVTVTRSTTPNSYCLFHSLPP